MLLCFFSQALQDLDVGSKPLLPFVTSKKGLLLIDYVGVSIRSKEMNATG